MSSINGIIGNAFGINHVKSPSSISHRHGRVDNDGDNDNSKSVGKAGNPHSFVSAMFKALMQIGAPDNSASSTDAVSASGASSSGGTTPQDIQQALQAFLQDLFGALQSLGGNKNANGKAGDGDGDNDASNMMNTNMLMYGNHNQSQSIENKLQALIQQISATGETTGSSSGDPISSLQQDFQNLLSSLGAKNSQTSLGDFLKNVSSNLQGSNPGMNINTTV